MGEFPVVTNDKTGVDLMDEIVVAGETRYMNDILDRNPFAVPLTDEELRQEIINQRKARAAFILKEEKAKMKKQGIEE